MRPWWNSLNTDQRILVSRADVIPQDYFHATWRVAVRAIALLVALLLIIRLISIDPAVSEFAKNSRKAKYFEGLYQRLQSHWHLTATLLALLVLLLIPHLASLSKRMARSWSFGIWRAAPVSFFFLGALYFSRRAFGIRTLILLASAIAIVDYVPFFAAQLRKLAALKPDDVLKVRTIKSPLKRSRSSLDDPIGDWSQDTLHRSSLADTLKVKLLVGEAPVIALRGRFGAGKSSVLNLLRDDLREDAIVVSFSTWLPGSEQTLTKELLHDISKECRRRYHLPGLREAIVKYTRVFSADVPYFKGLNELLQPPTQREELEEVKNILEKLPKRIVVLLDEIDRMRRKELLTLLKLIRGMGAIPNLSFVCAFDREQVERIVCRTFDESSHEYFEKFFPTAIDLPEIQHDLLKEEFIETLTMSIFVEGWS